MLILYFLMTCLLNLMDTIFLEYFVYRRNNDISVYKCPPLQRTGI
jgi:hypothetical protein